MMDRIKGHSAEISTISDTAVSPPRTTTLPLHDPVPGCASYPYYGYSNPAAGKELQAGTLAECMMSSTRTDGEPNER